MSESQAKTEKSQEKSQEIKSQEKPQKEAESKTKTKVKAPVSGSHPKQHKVNVIMTDGTKFEILSTWGKEGDTLRLDVDPRNHPAWQEKGQNFVNASNERVAKFKNKFGNFDFVAGANSTEKKKQDAS